MEVHGCLEVLAKAKHSYHVKGRILHEGDLSFPDLSDGSHRIDAGGVISAFNVVQVVRPRCTSYDVSACWLDVRLRQSQQGRHSITQGPPWEMQVRLIACIAASMSTGAAGPWAARVSARRYAMAMLLSEAALHPSHMFGCHAQQCSGSHSSRAAQGGCRACWAQALGAGSLDVALAEGWRHALADAPPEGVLGARGQHRRAGRAGCPLQSTCMHAADLQCTPPASLVCQRAGSRCWTAKTGSKTGSAEMLAVPCCTAARHNPSACAVQMRTSGKRLAPRTQGLDAFCTV